MVRVFFLFNSLLDREPFSTQALHLIYVVGTQISKLDFFAYLTRAIAKTAFVQLVLAS